MDRARKTVTDGLASLVQEQVTKTPDGIAVVYDDGSQTPQAVSITYREMWERAQNVCVCLMQYGVWNQTVGVCIEPSVNLPSVLLGILQRSSCFYPFGVDGIGFVKQTLQKLSVQHIIVDTTSLQQLQSMLLELSAEVLNCPDLLAMGLCLFQTNTTTASSQDENLKSVKWVPGLAYCITTSGTTGRPKLVRVPHACIVPNILDLRQEFKMTPADIAFLASPLTFDPSIVEIFVTLTSGAALLIVPPVVKMSANILLKKICVHHRVTVLQLTPTLLSRFGVDVLQRTLLGQESCLRVLAVGGEPFPSNLLASALRPENHTTIYNLYGITEVSCWTSIQCVRHLEGIEEPVSVGRPLSGTRIRLVDDGGGDLTLGTGEIWIGGHERVCLLNDEDTEVMTTANAVWRATGDQGRIDRHGRIFCMGRNDRQIKRNGKRLDLSTLEKVCCELESVDDCRAAFAENRLHLFVVKLHATDLDHETLKKIKCHLLKMLPSQYQPDTIRIVQTLPVSQHGKLDTAALLTLDDETEGKTDQTDVAVDVLACKFWQESIGSCKDISPKDNFLVCGGDSLKAVQLVEKVEQKLGQNVPGLLEVILTGMYEDFVTCLMRLCSSISATESLKRKVEYQNGNAEKKLRVIGSSLSTSSENGDQEKVRSAGESQTDYTLTQVAPLHPPLCQVEGAVGINGLNNKERAILVEDSEVTPESDLTVSGSGYSTDPVKSTEGSIPNTDMPCASDCDGFVVSISRGSTVQYHSQENGHLSDLTLQRSSDYSVPSSGAVSASTCNVQATCSNLPCDRQVENIDAVGAQDSSVACKCQRRQTTVSLEFSWKVNTGKCVDASPLVAVTRSGKKVVFIGSHSHQFYAISMTTGEVLWCTELGDRVEGSACLSACGKFAVVGCYDHNIYILDVHSGEISWQVETGDVVKCTPVADVLSGLTLCGSHDGCLYALNCKNQQVVWRREMGGGSVFASPAVSPNGITYAATLAGQVKALKVSSGEISWGADIAKPIFSSLVLDGDNLYVGCVDGCLYCLNTLSGEQRWIFKTDASIFSSPDVTKCPGQEPKVVFGSHDKHFYCLSSSGQCLWQHPCQSTVYSSPFVFQDAVYSKSAYGDSVTSRQSSSSCHCSHKKRDGSSAIRTADSPVYRSIQTSVSNVTEGSSDIAQRSSEQESVSSPMTKLNGRDSDTAILEECSHSGCSPEHHRLVACASTDGTIFILDSETGVQLGNVKLPGDVFSSPVVVGDQLVVGCRDDYVYCYRIIYHTHQH